MSAEQLPIDQMPAIQGPSNQTPEDHGPSVPEQPPIMPRISMRELRELKATGIKLKEEIEAFKTKAHTAHEWAKDKSATRGTMETALADANRLGQKGMELSKSFTQYRTSAKETLRRAEVQLTSAAAAKDTDEAKRITRVKEKAVKSCRVVYEEACILHREMLLMVKDLCADALAIEEVVRQKEEAETQERQRRVNRMVLRMLNGAGF